MTISVPGADADSVWMRPDTACQECMLYGIPPCSVHGSTTLHGARLANRAGGDCRRLAAATGATLPGQHLLHLRATHAVAGWLLAGPGCTVAPLPPRRGRQSHRALDRHILQDMRQALP
eukprot:5842487-Pyramimonas_sp.AAC.1